MKKRNSLFFMGLGCMALALGAAPLINAETASAAKGARIEYGGKWGWDKKTGQKVQINESTSEYFTVVASEGAILTYKEGKADVSADPDWEGSGDEACKYYFRIPKKEKEITVKFKDTSDTVSLKVTATKAKGETTTENVLCKKAKYVPDAAGYKYGNITVEVEGASAGSFEAFVPNSDNGRHYKINKDEGDTPLFIFSREEEPKTEEEKAEDIEAMNNFLAPLLKDGATLTVLPGDECCSGTYSETEKYTYYEFENTGKELKVTKKTDTWKYKVKAAKLKIPKLKNAPKVKVDAVKGKLNLSAKLQYQFVPYDPSDWQAGDMDDNAWIDGKGKMTVNEVSSASITCGGILYVRTKATSKALYSKTTAVAIPSQQSIDVKAISTDGVTTGGTIKAGSGSDYEYTTENPAAGGKTWKPIKAAGIKFTAKNKATGSYYIRKKGVNAKGDTKMAMPSDIAVITVSGDSLKLTKDGTGTYVTTMPALY